MSAPKILTEGDGLRGWLGFLAEKQKEKDSGGGSAASASAPDDDGAAAAAGFQPASTPKDQKFISYTLLPRTFYNDAITKYIDTGSQELPKNMIVMEAEAVKAAVGPALLSLRAHQKQLKDAVSALEQLPQDADIQNKTALEFEKNRITRLVSEGEDELKSAAERYESLRPEVMEVVAGALHKDCLSYEQALGTHDPAVRDEITRKAAEMGNVSPLRPDQIVKIVAPGPRYEKARVVKESPTQPGHWELMIWDEVDNLKREYSAGFNSPQTLPRSAIYAKEELRQMVSLDGTDAAGNPVNVPPINTPAFILVMMKCAEDSKEGFEAICKQVKTEACQFENVGEGQVVTVFSRLKSIDRITKKGADKYKRKYNMVLDVLRMTFVCHSVHGVLATLVCLGNAKGVRLVRIKNRMHPAFDHRNSTTAGYHGDLLINVVYEATGFVCECQITLRGLQAIREGGAHGNYNLVRVIGAREKSSTIHRGRVDADILDRAASSMLTKLDCRGTVFGRTFATTLLPEKFTSTTCHLTEFKLSGCVGLEGVRLDAVMTTAVCKQLGPTLKILEARESGFCGPIPTELWRHFVKLDILYLSSNHLEGPALPESVDDFGCKSSLRIVTVGGNETLCGQIPKWIGECKALVELHMGKNMLEGSVPEEIADCPKLEILNVGRNKMSGTIPKALGRCANLQKLFMNENDAIEGTIPSELGNCKNLKMLNLCGNPRLGGAIPDEIGQCTGLVSLELHGTGITHCPDSLVQCRGIIGKVTLPLETCNNPPGHPKLVRKYT